MQGVQIEAVLEQRDVAAGLYLLERMLGTVTTQELNKRRGRLEELKKQLKRGKISDPIRREIVSAYREVIG